MLDFTQNYFELFGLPVAFDVDARALAERFRDLQRVVHPDRYASAGEQERRLSMQGSVLLNEAFQTLKDPLRRAQYLLRLRGAPEAPAGGQLAPSFLMQQMELREELAEIGGEAEPLRAAGAFLARVRGLVAGEVGALSSHLAAEDSQSLDRAREAAARLQFLRRLQEEAEALEAELEDMP
jgi:molecular chaperone HscB